jgi:hypothetical protein
MQQFSVRPNSFKEIQKRLIRRMATLFGGVTILVLVVPSLISGAPFDLVTLPILLVLFSAVFAFSIWNSMKKQKALFESLKIIIDDDKITRERLNTPQLVIYKKDVKRITKSVEGNISIEGDNKWNPIVVPAQIENNGDIERILGEISTIVVLTKKPIWQKFFVPISMSGAALYFGMFYATNKYVSIVCGLLLLAVFGFTFVVTLTNKNIDNRTKRFGYVSLILVVVVIYNLYHMIFD